jgi:hypothetical protein
MTPVEQAAIARRASIQDNVRTLKRLATSMSRQPLISRSAAACRTPSAAQDQLENGIGDRWSACRNCRCPSLCITYVFTNDGVPTFCSVPPAKPLLYHRGMSTSHPPRIRKRVIASDARSDDSARAIDLAASASFEYTSEHPKHCVENILDDYRGPGGTYWSGSRFD